MQDVNDLLDSVDWGSAPEWLAALGSILAFGLGVAIYWGNSRDNKRTQARLVSAIGLGPPRRLTKTATSINALRGEEQPGLVHHQGGDHYGIPDDVLVWRVKIMNRSQETVSRIEGEIVSREDDVVVRFRPIRVLAPQSDVEFHLVSRYDLTRETETALHVRFTDAAGRRWTRYGTQPVKPMRGGSTQIR